MDQLTKIALTHAALNSFYVVPEGYMEISNKFDFSK